MNEKKKLPWSWFSPLEWLNAAFALLVAIFTPLLRWLGMLTPPSTEGFANIQRADVEDAAKLAAEQEASVDALNRAMSPAEVVRAYAKADVAGRAGMDLSALDFAEQDWLLRLSEDDLSKLSMSTTSGCARSLEQRQVLPIYARPQPEMETPEIYMIPSEADEEQRKRQYIAERFRQVQRELWLAPGVPNPQPKHIPCTVH